jgi:hypothetical protein
VQPGSRLDEAREIVHSTAVAAGRDPSDVGMEGRIGWGSGSVDDLAASASRWRESGATHIALNTMGSGLSGVDGHLSALARAAEALSPREP